MLVRFEQISHRFDQGVNFQFAKKSMKTASDIGDLQTDGAQ